MKYRLYMTVALLLSAQAFAEPKCEEDVDMADSLDFSRTHIECANDPVTVYDPDSKSSFFGKKEEVVTAYATPVKADGSTKAGASAAQVIEQQTIGDTKIPASDSASAVASQSSNAGVVFNIREPFTVTGGPQSALNGLFVQMAGYCPSGWEKLKEWSVPNQSGYYLHYQFQCAE